MKQARDSRSFGGGRMWHIKIIGRMIGTLFIRSYERGERVYSAMTARGFDGQGRSLTGLSFSRADGLFGVGVASLVVVNLGFSLV